MQRAISPPTYEAAAAAVALGIAFVGLAGLAARALRAYLHFAARTVRAAAMRLSPDGA
jgi:urease accessory protein UreF